MLRTWKSFTLTLAKDDSKRSISIIFLTQKSLDWKQRPAVPFVGLWEDNIKEWTGLEWNILLRKAENREVWRKLVVKSTVVPQRSARLQDR